MSHRVALLGLAAAGLSATLLGCGGGDDPPASPEPPSTKLFKDESSSRGLTDEDDSFATAMVDVDGDGDLDIFVTNNMQANKLYLNDGKGQFKELENPAFADADVPSRGVVFADFDGDGDVDLFISAWEGQDRLYIQTSKLVFEDKTAEDGVGILDDISKGQGVCVGDIDLDGDLDIFVANFAETDHLYINAGDAKFTNETASRGLESEGVKGFGCVLVDVDNDGDLDLYVNNDGTNKLSINDGKGVFSDAPADSGANVEGKGRGVQAADFNNDGHMDLFIVNLDTDPVLLMNDGTGKFTDKSAEAGLVGLKDPDTDATDVQKFGLQAGDFDGDGDIDVVISALKENHLVLRNDGTGKFTNIAAEAGIPKNLRGHGAAFGDIDGDGTLEFLVTSWGAYPDYCDGCSGLSALMLSKAKAAKWLKVKPVTKTSKHPTLLGLDVRVKEAGKETFAAARATIDGGSGFCSQNAYEAYFGLSKSTASKFDIEIRRGTALITKKNVDPNQVVEVEVDTAAQDSAVMGTIV